MVVTHVSAVAAVVTVAVAVALRFLEVFPGSLVRAPPCYPEKRAFSALFGRLNHACERVYNVAGS